MGPPVTRMGHDSPRAALIYQHANREADQGIAEAIDKAVKAARAQAQQTRAEAGRRRWPAGCRGELMAR
ncbi:hypothetical protein [Micromonospora sp. NPDC047730]|uniref:hypothetical protein n=1 Tax=Micromonospora sp. NPDC047730 TaxID=3364253 RepID=UPI00370FC104